MAFFGLFGVFELLFFVGFFLLMIVGCTFDRRFHNESPKWYIFLGGLIIVAVWHWSGFTFIGPADVPAVMSADGKSVLHEAEHRVVLWNIVREWSFWAPLGGYLLAGLVYSIIEFVFDVRRSARYYSDEWKQFITGTKTVKVFDADGQPIKIIENDGRRGPTERFKSKEVPFGDLIKAAKADHATLPEFDAGAVDASATYALHETHQVKHADAYGLAKSFIDSYRFKDRIIELTTSKDKLTVEPRVNKFQLAQHIAAWVMLWPFYLVSLILGDLLTEVFNVIADFFVHLSGRFVRMSFANAFKLS